MRETASDPPQAMDMVASRDLSLLVLSCDKYKDLWDVFAHYFRTNWPDCPFPVYLLTNEETHQADGIVSLQTGADVGWSDSVIRALAKLQSKYVLFLMDDTFLHVPFQTSVVLDALEFLERAGGTCVKLRPLPFPLQGVPGEVSYGRLSADTPYRNGLFMSIWNRPCLLGYLKKGESAWQFETLASSRTEADKGFYAVRQDHFKFIHAIIKGRWIRSSFERVSKDLPGYTTSRPVMSVGDEWLFEAYFAIRKAFLSLAGVRAFKLAHRLKWSWLGTRGVG